jgi:pimeloyl-ACP methyl ester carboxylesterase
VLRSRLSRYSPRVPRINVKDIELFYETAGDPSHPPLLLIAGLGVQLIGWPAYFVDSLAECGLYVIYYDNRDIGLSTTFDGGQHDPHAVMGTLLAGEAPDLAYTLVEMADDAAELLDALGIESAHVAGVSMGGMIAQIAAIRHPEKVRSLISIMSTTGAPDVGQPTAEAMEAILSSAPGTQRSEVMAYNVQNAKVWASPDHFDAGRINLLFQDSWDRAGGPQALNAGRQFCAIVASAPRDDALASLDIPALVVHGTADTLVPQTGGQRTAEMINGANLLVIEGMGHDLVPAFVPEIVKAMSSVIHGTTAS